MSYSRAQVIAMGNTAQLMEREAERAGEAVEARACRRLSDALGELHEALVQRDFRRRQSLKGGLVECSGCLRPLKDEARVVLHRGGFAHPTCALDDECLAVHK